MLRWIPVLGPWFASIVEQSAGERIVRQAIAAVITIAVFALVLLGLAVAGRTLDVAGVTSWLVDAIVMT